MIRDTPARPAGRSVLVVDDSTAARRELCDSLERAGLHVTAAGEGVEALYRARQTAFDLVLTDVHMPTMDGLTFLAELRKLPAYASTPVFVLTSDCSRDRLSTGRALGATAWIIKPPNLPALVLNVQRALEARPPNPQEPR